MRDESLNDTTISQVSNSEVSALAAAESLNQTKMFLSSLNLWQIIFATSSIAKADVLKLPKPELEPQPISISCNIYRHYPTRPCFSTVCVGWVMVIIDIKVSTLVHRVQWPLCPSSGSWRIMYHLGIISVSSWYHPLEIEDTSSQTRSAVHQGEYLLPWRRIHQRWSTLNLSFPRSSPGLKVVL